MTTMYRATVQWDGKAWRAEVAQLPGAHTYARTVDSLRKRAPRGRRPHGRPARQRTRGLRGVPRLPGLTAVAHETVGQVSKPVAPGYDELPRIVSQRDALRAQVDELSEQLAERTAQGMCASPARRPEMRRPVFKRAGCAPVGEGVGHGPDCLTAEQAGGSFAEATDPSSPT